MLVKQGETKEALETYDEAMQCAPKWKELKEARDAAKRKISFRFPKVVRRDRPPRVNQRPWPQLLIFFARNDFRIAVIPRRFAGPMGKWSIACKRNVLRHLCVV